MKNKVKKIFAVILLALFSLSSVAPAFAANDGLSFGRNSNYVVKKAFDRTPNTIEAWVKLRSTQTGNFSLFSNYGLNMYPCVALEVKKGNPSLLWGDPDYIKSYTFTEVNLLTEEWLHLAVVRDYESSKALCYVNGELAGSIDMHPTAKELVSSTPFIIGGDHREFNSQPFAGRVRSIAVYDSARTKEQILADMSSPEKSESLIAMYEINSSDTLTDLSGNGYDADKTSVKLTRYVMPEDQAPLEDYDYTFAVLGDTQIVTESYPNEFPKIYDYILNNKDTMNIKYVMGLGDITNNSTQREWDVAMKNILRLKGKIPFSLARGNHDTRVSFDKNFSYKDYGDTVDGAYNNNMINTWKAFTVGQRKFIVFTLDFGPSQAVLDWASEIIKAHPDHNVIITTHAYIFRDGNFHDASYAYPPSQFGGVLNGDQIWDRFVRKHKNIVLVLCGHTSSDHILIRNDVGDNGNIITTMLINPQDVDTKFKGLGMVATLHLREDDNTVQLRYYSSIKEKYFTKSSQCTIKLNFVNEDYSSAKPTPSPEITDTPTGPEATGSDTTVIKIVLIAIIVLGIASIVFTLVNLNKKKK